MLHNSQRTTSSNASKTTGMENFLRSLDRRHPDNYFDMRQGKAESIQEYIFREEEPRGSSLLPKLVAKLFHLGGTGKIPGGILHLSITATMDPALIDRGNLIDGDWANYSWKESQN